MDQSNYIRDSKVKGNVYNEKIDNITFPKNHGNIMLCKNVRIAANGESFAKVCLVMGSEIRHKSPIEPNFANYVKAPELSDDLKDLYEANKWISQETASTE